MPKRSLGLVSVKITTDTAEALAFEGARFGEVGWDELARELITEGLAARAKARSASQNTAKGSRVGNGLDA